MTEELPRGYVRIARDGAVLVLKTGLEDVLLAAGIAFPDELVARSPAQGIKGRGALSLLELPSGRAVLRLYRRGGFFGSLVKRLSLDGERASAELSLHARALERGAPVAEPVAAVTRRSGVGFRHALATREVEEARDLERVLREARGKERRALIAAAGEAVRRLHDAGVDHADLNLKNVVVRARPGETASGVVLDLDRGRLAETLPESARRASLVRLLRSFLKLRARDRLAVSPRDPFRFARAYARGDRKRRREVVLWGREALPALGRRAFFWKLFGLVRDEGGSS